MQKINIILFAAIAVVFAGCASAPKPAAYDDSHSKAWNIATAAGLKNVKDYVVKDHTDLNTAALGGVYAGLSQLPGVSFSVTDIGVGMLSSILASGVKPAEAMPQLFIWLPAEQAETPDDAREKVITLLTDALKDVAGQFMDGDLHKTRAGPFFGGDTIYVNLYGERNGSAVVPHFSVNSPTQAYSPLWAGGYKAWKFGLEGQRASTGIGFMGLGHTKTLTDAENLKFNVLASKNLPDYFYIYLPATTKHGPLIINHGKILPFAKPKSVASK